MATLRKTVYLSQRRTLIITDPPNGPVLFCTLSSVGVVSRLSSSVTRVGGRPLPGRARGRSGGRHCTAGQYGYVPLGRHLVKPAS